MPGVLAAARFVWCSWLMAHGSWHLAPWAGVGDGCASSCSRVSNCEKHQESACAKVGEGAYSRGMADLLDTGSVVTDADEAVTVLTTLHPIFGGLMDALRV